LPAIQDYIDISIPDCAGSVSFGHAIAAGTEWTVRLGFTLCHR